MADEALTRLMGIANTLHTHIVYSRVGVRPLIICQCSYAGFSGLSGANLAALLQRRVGTGGTLEIYTSPGLVVTRIIGPVTDLRGAPAAALAAARGGSGGGAAKTGGDRAKTCARAVRLAGVERGLAVAFHMDVHRELPGGHAYIQVGCHS